MHWDWSINLPALGTWIVLGVTLLWKVSAFVAEMRAFRREFDRHTEDDREQFERVEDSIRSLREWSFSRK